MLRLTRHEKVLIILYRAAPREVRSQIDGRLLDEWTHLPLDSPEFHAAKARLHAEHLMGRAIAPFTTFWLQSKP